MLQFLINSCCGCINSVIYNLLSNIRYSGQWCCFCMLLFFGFFLHFYAELCCNLSNIEANGLKKDSTSHLNETELLWAWCIMSLEKVKLLKMVVRNCSTFSIWSTNVACVERGWFWKKWEWFLSSCLNMTE